MTHQEFIDNYLEPYGILYNQCDNILFVDGNLDFNNLIEKEISELPDNLHINGWIDIQNTHIVKLPENLYIKSLIFCMNSYIKELPDSILFGSSGLKSPTIGYKLLASEKLQMKLISQGYEFLECFKNPTKKAKILHKLLWNL